MKILRVLGRYNDTVSRVSRSLLATIDNKIREENGKSTVELTSIHSAVFLFSVSFVIFEHGGLYEIVTLLQ